VGRFRLFYVHPHLFQFGRLVLPIYGFLVALGTVISLLVCVRIGRLLSLTRFGLWLSWPLPPAYLEAGF
jgi:prolipoprotein diacylglyceryltransferase